MGTKTNLTPLMQQYFSIKNQHPDKIILFRMGDFFEMFHDDAVIAAPLINITLTQRNKKSNDSTPMCGVPHHSIGGPIAKLLKAGHKVAICDQLEDPKQAKGLVKRGVTQILTPGMVYDVATLHGDQHNYICALDEESVAFTDLSTGECFYYRINQPAQVLEFIQLLKPAELVVTESQKASWGSHWEKLDLSVSVHNLSARKLPPRWDQQPTSVKRLIHYIHDMQGEVAVLGIGEPEERWQTHCLKLNEMVIKHLEVFENYRGNKTGTLFESVNRTKTSSGSRMLKHWLRFPLQDVSALQLRNSRVQHWKDDIGGLKSFRQSLSHLGDVERRLGRLTSLQCHPRDLVSLGDSLEAGLRLSKMNVCKAVDEKLLSTAHECWQLIRKTINEEPPLVFKNGGVIRKGLDSRLDEFIELSENSKQKLMQMEAKERETYGIPSLKIKYNNVFGYFIEVTNTHRDKVPDHYKRKQTLTNAERYVTEELHELESKILSALSRRSELESEIFRDLKHKIQSYQLQLLKLAGFWSEWDVLSSFAWLALEYNYTKPEFVDSGIDLKGSRHPVLEQSLTDPFVANDIQLHKGQCLLLTGPNMAGKSTIMRQVALTVILAQAGSFVPASAAKLQMFDKIFTRIGASDFLSEGLSTFMVEMVESAKILQQVNENSLVVMDEIGRGTSTYDGMSLAQSILEYLVEQSGAILLFATHYHELTRLSAQWKQMKNAHMTIKEDRGNIAFLHTLAPGAANRSYGIQVAKLAGLPTLVTRRAERLLKGHESFNSPESQQMTLLEAPAEEETSDFSEQWVDLVENIKNTSIQSMTPLDAMNKIAEWQRNLS